MKEDNNAILGQLDKFNKRIRQLEGEIQREQDHTKEKDAIISDLNKQNQFLIA